MGCGDPETTDSCFCETGSLFRLKEAIGGWSGVGFGDLPVDGCRSFVREFLFGVDQIMVNLRQVTE